MAWSRNRRCCRALSEAGDGIGKEPAPGNSARRRRRVVKASFDLGVRRLVNTIRRPLGAGFACTHIRLRTPAMSLSYTIDAKRRLIIVRAGGVLTEGDVIRVREQ